MLAVEPVQVPPLQALLEELEEMQLLVLRFQVCVS
jgi:hypothetical protein